MGQTAQSKLHGCSGGNGVRSTSVLFEMSRFFRRHSKILNE
jgi:hypothetical protein